MSMLRKWVKKIPGAFRLYQTIYPWIAPDRHPYQVASWVRRNLAFAEKHRLSEMVFGRDGAWVRDETGLEFLYQPEWQGGVGGLEFGRRHEAAEIDFVVSRLTEGCVVLDIGANVGLHALRIANTIDGARVFAFEPVAATAMVLERNIRRNHLKHKVTLFRVAIGDSESEFRMTTDQFTGNHVIGSGDPLPRMKNIETIPCMTLDSFVASQGLKQLDLVKCDVEGVELLVLRGALGVIERFHPRFFLEIYGPWTERYGYRPQAVFDFLRDKGYAYLRITDDGQVLPPSGSFETDLAQGHDFYFHREGT